MIPDLLKVATGVDLIAATVEVAFGNTHIDLTCQSTLKPVSTYVVHSSCSGVLNYILFEDDLKKKILKSTFYCKSGGQVSTFTSADKALGVVIFEFEHEQEMVQCMNKMEHLIHVSVKKVTTPASEVGGYFELEQFRSFPFYNGLVEVNSGRNALAYLIESRRIRQILLPSYLCTSIAYTCQRYKVLTRYYTVSKAFLPELSGPLESAEYLYVVNYFGQLSNATIADLHMKFGRIIVDNSQSFFQQPVRNVDTLYSCRKYFGVPDGAYVSTTSRFHGVLPMDQSRKRMEHLLGRFETHAAAYYESFTKASTQMKDLPLSCMSKLTKNLLGAIDYERVAAARTENFQYLHSRLSNSNELKLLEPFGAFAYPFYTASGSEIRRGLIAQCFYVPKLWPGLEKVHHNDVDLQLVEHILPLPCDQRYTIVHMEALANEVLRHLKR